MRALTITKRPAVRFEYDRMTGEQFSEGLTAVGMKGEVFARLFGMNDKTVREILAGRQDVPKWCPPVLVMLLDEKAKRAAFDVAAALISADREHPERGAYPYRAGRYAED